MSRKLHSYAVAFSRSVCYNDRMIPSDPMLLYSYLNMKLRDEYGSLDALCDDLELDRADLEARLAAVGFFYDEKENRFR